jgi:hypothetical protein
MKEPKTEIASEECLRAAELATALSQLSARVEAGETLTEEDWSEVEVILAGLADVLQPALCLIKEQFLEKLKSRG